MGRPRTPPARPWPTASGRCAWLRATNGLIGENEVLVTVDRLIALPNAGFRMLSTCGSPPILGVGLSAAAVALGTGEPAVNLSWGPGVDEAGGEADVVRYT